MLKLITPSFFTDDIMAVIKLDNQTVGQTSWRPCSQQAWDQRYFFTVYNIVFARYIIFIYCYILKRLYKYVKIYMPTIIFIGFPLN